MAKAIIKISSAEGKHLLNEIQGLKEETVVSGKYDPKTGAFDFKHNGLDAVVWIGVNAELVDTLIQEPGAKNTYCINGYAVMLSVQLFDKDFDFVGEFDTMKEARKHAKFNHIKNYHIAYVADMIDDGECNILYAEDVTKRSALSRVRDYFKGQYNF